MTYADAYAQAEREWERMDTTTQIHEIDADADGLSRFWYWQLREGSGLRGQTRKSVRDYLRQHPRCAAWLDRRAVAIQEQAAGHDDGDTAHDYAKENP